MLTINLSIYDAYRQQQQQMPVASAIVLDSSFGSVRRICVEQIRQQLQTNAPRRVGRSVGKQSGSPPVGWSMSIFAPISSVVATVLIFRFASNGRRSSHRR